MHSLEHSVWVFKRKWILLQFLIGSCFLVASLYCASADPANKSTISRALCVMTFACLILGLVSCWVCWYSAFWVFVQFLVPNVFSVTVLQMNRMLEFQGKWHIQCPIICCIGFYLGVWLGLCKKWCVKGQGTPCGVLFPMKCSFLWEWFSREQW